MAYWCDITISKLELKIPKKDLPLKSDLIIGVDRVHMLYPCDEGSYEELHPDIIGDNIVFIVSGDDEFTGCNSCCKRDGSSLYFKECDNAAIEELEKLCIKYGGTLVAEIQGEDSSDGTDYIRIRNGVKKKVKLIEES